MLYQNIKLPSFYNVGCCSAKNGFTFIYKLQCVLGRYLILINEKLRRLLCSFTKKIGIVR